MKTPSVSIVIPAFNEAEKIGICLAAIAKQAVEPLEVIVVDNNSIDGTAEIARTFPFVRVVTEKRQGRVFARNTGFNAARGDIIGRIDADIVLPKHWVEHISAFYSSSLHKGQAWTGGANFYNVRLPRFVSWAYTLLAFWFNKLWAGHYTLWGSNMAITRQQWQRVRGQVCGRNDIHEDLDLAIHVANAGYGITYDKSIVIDAELRRVHQNRDQLWGYLQWWPRTLRVHDKPWVSCWFWCALGLYFVSFAWPIIDALAGGAERRTPSLSPLTQKD